MSITKRQTVFEKTGGHCWYCGAKLDAAAFDIDHATPKSRGGNSGLSNLLPACCRCNRSKRDKTVEEYRTWLEWCSVGCEPFTVNQIAWLRSNNVFLPKPDHYFFWGELHRVSEEL